MVKRRSDRDGEHAKTPRPRREPAPAPDVILDPLEGDAWNEEIDDDLLGEMYDERGSGAPWPRWED